MIRFFKDLLDFHILYWRIKYYAYISEDIFYIVLSTIFKIYIIYILLYILLYIYIL